MLTFVGTLWPVRFSEMSVFSMFNMCNVSCTTKQNNNKKNTKCKITGTAVKACHDTEHLCRFVL